MLKYICLFIFCLCIVGCKKTKEDPYQNHMLAQETFDYGYFKVGTYWIYKDSITGAEDCVYVFYNYTQIDTILENNYYEYDAGLYNWFDVQCHSTFYNLDYQYWCNSSFANEYSGFLNGINRESSNGGSTIVWTNTKEIGKKVYPNYEVVTLTDLIPSFKSFTNVTVFNDDKNSTEGNYMTDFYASQNVGIIKKIIHYQYNWDLVRYHIIQ